MIQSLKLMGLLAGMVVCGTNGLDEISPEGETHVRIHISLFSSFTRTISEINLIVVACLSLSDQAGCRKD